MKNICKHPKAKRLAEANTFTHRAEVYWCGDCGASRYFWDTEEYNKKYGKWRSPKFLGNVQFVVACRQK